MLLYAGQLCELQDISYTSYDVHTEDGYILRMARLSPKGASLFEERPPVYLQHGLQDSSDGWLCSGAESISFQLVREGYDVWLGNFRGNKYSNRHINLDPKTDLEYWQFSYAEMGRYDIPAMIQHIRRVKDWPGKVAYVGHSMGTTAMFYALATNHQAIQEMCSVFIALAPVVEVTNSPSSLL